MMKFFDAFTQIFQKKQEKGEAYLSLVLEESAVQVALWSIKSANKPHISEAASERVTGNGWDKRLEACDRAIARLAEKEGRDDFEKVVLGLPAAYLTAEDEVEHAERPHIKKLTEELELSPIGFVPIHQAIAHQIREEEGVPPSVILIEVDSQESTLILYRVGAMVGKAKIANNDFVPSLEKILKGFKDIEVLPSRILLYGGDPTLLDSCKRDCLKHPWPTRANFLHYPKIEVLPAISLAAAVSLAGASELASEVGISNEQNPGVEAAAVIEPEPPTGGEIAAVDQEVDEVSEPTTEVGYSADETNKEEEEHKEVGEVEMRGEDIGEPDMLLNEDDADANITEVAPETLGFHRDTDILERPTVQKDHGQKNIEEEVNDTQEKTRKLPSFIALTQLIPKFRFPGATGFPIPKRGFLVLLSFVLLVAILGWFLYWVMPQANVIVYQVPFTITESSPVTISPTATVVDATTKIVPGRKQERTVSGDKTIAVTGKKDIGDPATGSVIIYNKSLLERLFKKGTVLVAGSLQFTLDTDIKVASATESFTNREYGSASVAVTAAKLGPQGNLPSGTEFAVKDFSEEVAVARNDKPFAGGTSKSVTVVSRADYDALVAALTDDLIGKAKTELSGSVGGSERLIDETIKTAVSQKKFDQELDQESDKLHGSITMSISGLSYNADEVATLFTDLVSGDIPSGYALEKDIGKVTVSNVQMNKDGSILVSARYQGAAVPKFDFLAMKRAVAGKSTSAGEQYFRGVSGVGGIEMTISRSPWKTTFPVNANNISFSVRNLE